MRTNIQQVEWRRSQVLELMSEGLNQSDIARKLQIHKSAISRDINYLREYAHNNIQTHLQENIPEEYQLCMAGLNHVLKKSWEIVNSSTSTDDRTKLQALSLANDCYKYKMDLVTNGVVITDAIKFVQQREESLKVL